MFAPLATAAAMWVLHAPAQEAEEVREVQETQEAAPPPVEVWRPAPPATKMPYPLRPVVPKEKQRHERLATMSLDGTFESFTHGTPVTQLRDDNGAHMFFGISQILNTGYKSRASLFIPSGGGTTCGVEEKFIPLKPDTWYRASMMVRGVPYKLSFYYPVKPPENKDYVNEVCFDHNHGGGYSFYYVCSKCNYFKEGRPDVDGHWVMGGFRVIPDACPECGEKDSLYRDGDRRNYPEWTFIFADFKTSDYVGRMSNGVYYWNTIFQTGAANTHIDNFLVYEITGEGGDPVGGDEYVPPAEKTGE